MAAIYSTPSFAVLNLPATINAKQIYHYHNFIMGQAGLKCQVITLTNSHLSPFEAFLVHSVPYSVRVALKHGFMQPAMNSTCYKMAVFI